MIARLPRTVLPDADDYNAVVDALEQLAQASGQSHVAAGTGVGPASALALPVSIWGRITGASTAGKYPWTRVIPTGTGTYANATFPDLVTGTATSLPAVETQGRTDVPVGTVVRLAQSEIGPWFDFTHQVTGPGPAATGFFTRRTECVIGEGPFNYPGGESAYGIRLGVGQSLHGTLVVSGQMVTAFRQSVNISTSAIVQVEKLNNVNLASAWYAQRGVSAGINALTHGSVDYAASFAVAMGITEIAYDSPHPTLSSQYVIVNTGASETLVIARIRPGFGTTVTQGSAVWSYTIY